MERRFLSWEIAERTGQSFQDVEALNWLANPGGRFHGLDQAPPSTRAAVVLNAAGCEWREWF